MQGKKQIGLGLLAALIALFGVMLVVRSDFFATNPADRSIPQPDWTAMHDSISSFLVADTLALNADSLSPAVRLALQRFERLVFLYKDSSIAAPIHYANVALKCAKARSLMATGDPYGLLRLAEEVSLENVDSLQTLSIFLELAREFAHNGLYRRAWELLNEIPDSYNFAEAETLKQALAPLKARSAAYARSSVRAFQTPSRPDDSFEGRVWDMLTIAPDNPWYDEFQMAQQRDQKLFNPQRNAVDRLFLRPLFERNHRTQVDMRMGLRERLVAFELPDTARVHGFVSQLEGHRSNLSAYLKAHPVVKAITEILQPQEDPLGEPAPDIVLYDALLDENKLALAFWKGFNEWDILAFREDVDGNVSIARQPQFGLEQFLLLDVTGDGAKELIITDRQGSGGFLYVDIIDLNTFHLLWQADASYHGVLTFVDIDLDEATEIILSYATGDRIVDCNQCPSVYGSMLFDYDAARRTFALASERTTSAEMLLRTHQNLMGMSPSMNRSILFDGGPMSAQSANQWLDDLERTPPEAWTDSLFEEAFLTYEYERELLMEMSSYGTAAHLSERLAAALSRDDVPQRWQLFKLFALEEQTVALFQAGQLDEVIRVGQTPAYLAAVDTFDVLAVNYYNTMGLTYLLRGEYSTAYRYLRQGMDRSGGQAEAILGNISLYFHSIDDKASARTFASQALDMAVQSGNIVGQVIDMIHLASAKADNDTPLEQLDWLIRAVKRSRAFLNGGTTALALQTGAAIALDQERPDLALALLDEAVAIVDGGTWRTEGPSLIYLYGRAYRQQGDVDLALKLFRVAMKLGEEGRDATYVSASYEISRIQYEAHNFPDALHYAHLAFEATGARRQSIGEEPQKFAFLVSKRTIAAWYMHLLFETQTTPAQLLEAVESWKMQTFIDVYEQRGVFTQAVATDSIPQRLSVMLRPDELFLNYVLAEPTPFVLAVSPQWGTRLIPLPGMPETIQALVQQVRRHMNIRDPAALQAIRRNRIPKDLSAGLQALYDHLLAPVDIDAGTTRLIISSDEVMFGIPWSALQINAGTYLLDRYEVVQVPSGRMAYNLWQRSAQRPRLTPRRALVVAALASVSNAELLASLPSLRTTHPTLRLSRLYRGWDEARSVAKSLEASQYTVHYLVDEDTRSRQGLGSTTPLATPEQFLRTTPGANIVHVVAHGVFNPFDPMQSSLFLETGGAGRVLKANDLLDITLEDVELISLAACQTGISDARPGAEPVGFLRALLGAGALNVILTEWEVDDNTTAQIFAELYANVKLGPKSAALTTAQKRVRATHKHPYYWAGISLYGSTY